MRLYALDAVWVDFRNGFDSGYPLCCVIRFALCRYDHQGARRGGNCEWVVCGVFHRATDRNDWDWNAYLGTGWRQRRRMNTHPRIPEGES